MYIKMFSLIIMYCMFAGILNAEETTKKGRKKTILKTEYGKLQIFPKNNSWNQDISNYPIHPQSGTFLNSIGLDKTLHADFGTEWNGVPNGIPFCVAVENQPLVPIEFTYNDESDPGPYPIPDDAPIEGGENGTGDRHVIVIDYFNKKLYELFGAYKTVNGWKAGSGAIFNLDSNKLRTLGWTSADAAGLPIFPGLVRYEEKEITHAIRFTVSKTQKGYILPATHFASTSTDNNLPPMGLRLRLKKDFNISGFSKKVQVILTALKKYGMILADNGGDMFISGVPNKRWSDDELGALKNIKCSDFEVVYTGEIIH